MPNCKVIKVGAAWGGFGVTKAAEANNLYGWSDWVWDQHQWLVDFLANLGIHGWADFAGMVAGFYTTLMIGEWFWKKLRKRRRNESL